MQAALKQAMRDKDTITRDTLRQTLNAAKQIEVDEQRTLDDEAVLDVLMKEVKKRRDTIEELESAGRDDLLPDEQAQLAVLETFLPQQMTRDEIAAVVSAAIEQTGAESPKDMGRVMGVVMPQVRGKADGKLVNEVVRELLQAKSS